MFVSSKPRRLGDYAAGTIVVRERASITLRSLEPEFVDTNPSTPLVGEEAWDIDKLTLDDQNRIRHFLRTAAAIRPEHMRGRKSGQSGR